MKKICLLLLAVTLVLSSFSVFCFADDTDPYYCMIFDEDGKYGDIFSNGNNIIYEGFDEEKKCEVLTVAAGEDPYIYLSVTGIEDYYDELPNLDDYKFIQYGVKLEPSNGRTFIMYYTTDEDGSVDETKTSSAKCTDTTDVQSITFGFSKSKRWVGELAGLRIDPYSSSATEHTIELYYIAFFKSKDDATAFAAKYAEQGNEAFPELVTPTPKPTKTPAPATEEPTATPEVTDAPTEAPASKSGCGSTVISVSACITMLSALAILKKKKH